MKSVNVLQSVERIVNFLGPAAEEESDEMKNCKSELDAYVNAVLKYYNWLSPEQLWTKDDFQYVISKSRSKSGTLFYVTWLVLYTEGETEEDRNDTIVKVSKIKGEKNALLKIGYFPNANKYGTIVTPETVRTALVRYHSATSTTDDSDPDL